ncbi:DctP family TRAP transporter solute-binding subunit [Bordetella sp. 02P26C-1]|uniref:DctP family TRAP transporter solute-binding subunit n=1 Tax=Bordetella sp. 02P26C-1 TaxID=2683195 RepID=UPI00136533C0
MSQSLVRFRARPLVAAVLSTIMLAAVPAAHAQSKKELKISHSAAGDLSSEHHLAAWAFKNYLADNSDTVSARIYPSSALGDERAVFEGMQLGAGASCAVAGTAILNNFSKRVGVIDLPFLWKGYDHMNRTLDGKVGQAIAADLEKSGIKVLAWTNNWGARNVVTAKKTVNTADDLKGLKIRTIQSPIYVETINVMGANATPMSFGEIYTAMQTGVLDGFEHGAAAVVANKLYEVGKNVAITNHFLGPAVFACSMNEWNQLSDTQKKTVMDAAKFASDLNRSLAPIREQEALDFLKDKGMTITTVDTTPFRDKATALQDKIAANIGATDLLAEIRASQ